MGTQGWQDFFGQDISSSLQGEFPEERCGYSTIKDYREEGLPCCGESGKATRRREHLMLTLKDTGGSLGGHFRRQDWHEEGHGSRRMGLASSARV